MNQSSSIKLGGVVTFFRSSQYTHRQGLLDGLTTLGLAGFCPDKRTPIAALKDALESVFPTHRIETLKNKMAYEVISVDRGDDRNTYAHQFWVGIDKANLIDVRPFDYDMASAIAREFNKHLGLVNANAVTQCLIAVIAHYHGTHLGGRGNIYWLSNDRLREWQEVARVVESCPHQGKGNAVYCIPHELGVEAVRAVKDAITQEVTQESSRLHEEIISGELGERALENRQLQADLLRDKIALYEEILQVGLGSLREGLDKAEQAAVAARILSSAAAG